MFRVLLVVLSLLFAAYTGYDSYTITTTGIANGVSQLVGDGGGGLVFTALVFVGTILSIRWHRIAAAVLGLSAALALWVGMIYQDSMMMFWTVGAIVFSSLQVIAYVLISRRRNELRYEPSGGMSTQNSTVKAESGRRIASERIPAERPAERMSR